MEAGLKILMLADIYFGLNSLTKKISFYNEIGYLYHYSYHGLVNFKFSNQFLQFL